jgi:hypothetical protein
LLVFVCCLFVFVVVSFARFTVTGWAGHSNRAASNAPVELILLRLGVRWAVDAATALVDVLKTMASSRSSGWPRPFSATRP